MVIFFSVLFFTEVSSLHMFSLFLLRNIEHQQLSVPCYFYHSPYYSHAEKTTLSISKGVFFYVKFSDTYAS